MEDKTVEPPITNDDVMRMTTEIVASFVHNNSIPADSLPDILEKVHAKVHGLAKSGVEVPVEKPKPAVPIKQSVQKDYIVCLEDGKKLKMLKRYLRSNFDLTPEEYRRKWGLPADYPMVAPSYSEKRSQFARQNGLGKNVRRKGS